MAETVLEIDTPHGLGRATVSVPEGARWAVILGHGAGGGIAAADLQAVAGVAGELGFAVALIEQPYRVAGRRSPAPARQLDVAWVAMVAALSGRSGAPGAAGPVAGPAAGPVAGPGGAPLAGMRLIAGGRSSGARVACRTASLVGAVAVLCLAFPLHPPGKAADPAKSRLPELDEVGVPTLVVQGEHDPFGLPPDGPNRAVVVIPGTHTLSDRAAVAGAVGPWLQLTAFAAGG